MKAQVFGGETHKVALLCSRSLGSSREDELLPPLYSPQLVAIGAGAILLRGYESADGAGCVQEWRCVIA